MPQPLLLKIEISKRPVKWMESKDFELKQLISSMTPLGVSGFVVTLERAFLDKKKAFRERIKGRDLYDLWWLAQQLGEKHPVLNGRFNKGQISSELKRFLPKGNWWLIEDLLKT